MAADNPQYKKSYEGDYTKSYKDNATWKKDAQSKKIEYESISKKLNDQPYNKKEKVDFFDIAGARPKESERVNADGSSSSSSRKNAERKRNWEKEKTYTPKEQKKEVVTQTEKTINDIVKDIKEVPPVAQAPIYQEIKEEPRPWKNAYEVEAEEDDGNYNYYDFPLEEVGFQRYKNIKTGKEVTSDQARDVLRKAGYIPKAMDIGLAFFLFVISNIVFANAAPIVALGYGLLKMNTKNTTWTKTKSNQTYKYKLPATDEEMKVNKNIGKIAIVAGLIAAVIHYGKYF